MQLFQHLVGSWLLNVWAKEEEERLLSPEQYKWFSPCQHWRPGPFNGMIPQTTPWGFHQNTSQDGWCMEMVKGTAVEGQADSFVPMWQWLKSLSVYFFGGKHSLAREDRWLTMTGILLGRPPHLPLQWAHWQKLGGMVPSKDAHCFFK